MFNNHGTSNLRRLVRRWRTRLRIIKGLEPLAKAWGQRGPVIHRYYTEQFLRHNAADIRGQCLEFQEDSYTTRFGGDKVETLDILNKEPERANSTIVADLTADNDIPDSRFDCIICTYALHLIDDYERVVAELHRTLKPGGTLLVTVPDITINYPVFREKWRFTIEGLRLVLARHFGDGGVSVFGYGNSLAAAGELRGLSVKDFDQSELDHHDPRYSLVVCGRAVKPGSTRAAQNTPS